ncbi:MAG: carbon-nitrogen hydrolase family protein [Desulfobacteraceae bacterium]|nr:carbon-nitrogen hydrolase family protein [Desulfobacteraceae bacterium]
MKVTVCEMSNDPDRFASEWKILSDHAAAENSELILLPEMPFHPWLCRDRTPDPRAWAEAVAAHDRWMDRLEELAPAAVAATRPVIESGARFNEAFIREAGGAYRAVHRKVYLPDEEGYWEASWYRSGPEDFSTADLRGLSTGFLVCTEMWFFEQARRYGRLGAHILLCPRATPLPSRSKWIAGGRAAAVVSGAYCLSSNFRGPNGPKAMFGGAGWVIEPEEGDIIAATGPDRPFVTVDVDPAVADTAKTTYPRYVGNDGSVKSKQ